MKLNYDEKETTKPGHGFEADPIFFLTFTLNQMMFPDTIILTTIYLLRSGLSKGSLKTFQIE